MKRREFLVFSLLSTSLLHSSLSSNQDSWSVIDSVQNILFPKTTNFPSASEFKALRYLKMLKQDNFIDEDDLKFLLQGAKRLEFFGYKVSLKLQKREKILKEFSKTDFGYSWISTLLNYTIEALFSDPIYGGNAKEIGWKSFNHTPGSPRPKRKYAKSNV